MTVVKARKVGNSITITIPKELDIKTGQEFKVLKGSDGTLLFSPNDEKLLEEATDDLIREKLIDDLGQTIDDNLEQIKAGNFVTLEEMEVDLLG